MPKDIFDDRGRAEEAAYFRKQDEKLIEKLRARAKLADVAGALAEKLKVDNPDLLKRIVDLGVTLETGAAFVLAPLVAVAWADGDVSNAERDVVLRLAQTRGVSPGSPDHAQLLKWLENRPPEALFEASLEATKIGLSVLPPAEAEQRIAAMIKACEEVAEASGGLARLLQFHSGISPQEKSVLAEIKVRMEKKGSAGTT
jgi:hypothetical protein